MWSTPEYVIWLVTHNIKVLRHDGLSQEAALRKIDGLLRLSADPSHEPSWRLMPYLKRWLGLWWPDYAELGEDLLKGAIRIAKVRTNKWLKSDPGGWPPADWCRGSMTRTQFEERNRGRPVLPPRSMSDIAFTEIALRLRDDDEIRHFSSPADTWRMMMGRSGIAIVRGGRAIASLITMMN
jgi:hypothetical protein